MIKAVRYFWRLFITFIKRKKRLIFLGFALGILAFIFLSIFLRFLPARQETKTIGLVGRYTTENMPEEIQKLISIGLTRLETDGTPLPSLAKEWTLADKGKIYTFKLADNLLWHDGSKIKAGDINYNFQDVEMKIQDENTIQFILKEPFSPFPVIVSKPIFKKGLIGAGSYRVKKITTQGRFMESIFLESKEGGKPNLKYHFYPTEAAAKTALKLGEVKILENIVDPSGLEGWKNIQITSKAVKDRYVAVFLNTSNPLLEEKNFRQALAYAIPKEQGGNRTLGPISPLSWAYNDEVKPYEPDLENANKLLVKLREEGKKISIRLNTVSFLLPEAEKIRKAWEAIGIETQIGPMIIPGEDYQALLAIQEVPADPDQYSLWHSTQKTGNVTNFRNPRIDKLLEDGRKTSDRQERKKIYFDFQRYLVEEVPAIFLYNPTLYQISRK